MDRNAEMLANAGHAHLSTIEALAEALKARDSYTAGHGVRVAAYAIEIAKILGASQRDIEIVRIGAKLHDIGKIGVPDSILLKPAPLTEEECGYMRVHTRIGQRIIAKVPGLESLLAIVELHHENFDGSGYPYGLQGENIPLLARIVRVADAFDAMITDRVYRTAFSPERAIEQIQAGAGALFDPDVVAAFEKVVRVADRLPSVDESMFVLERLVTPA
ncbi:MAG TPA: HD-GYP domain-containing protein [Bryobacteraceae bacterium]|nr:HD-GYP domain-containing protein [Bryobacteraceae bacterium]